MTGHRRSRAEQSSSRAIAIVVTGLGVMQGACLSPEQISPPEGAVVDGAGVAVVRLENPVVRGNVVLTVEAELRASGLFTSRKVISPDAAFLTTDRPGVITDPWVWSAAEVGVPALGAPLFLAPSVSLPMGGAPVAFSLHTKRGRVRTEPVPPGTIPEPIGFDNAVVGTLSIALHPRVLVLPVRVHQFVDLKGRAGLVRPTTPAMMSQIFDPGAVATEGLPGSRDDGFTSSMRVVSGELLQFPQQEADPIWTQCDIQFHLESFDQIPQSQRLEITQATSCVCGSRGLFGSSQPISAFFPGRDGEGAIDVFLGGTISGDSCPFSFFTPAGVTCGPSTSGSGGCDDVVARFDFNVVLLDASAFGDSVGSPNLLSHELGHMLGLGHSDEAGRSCVIPDDTAGVPGLLMQSSAALTGFTPGQCARARCIAARWLEQFGRFSTAEREAVCAK